MNEKKMNSNLSNHQNIITPISASSVKDLDLQLETTILKDMNETKKSIELQKNQASSAKAYYERLYNDNEKQIIPYRQEIHMSNEKISNMMKQYNYLKQQMLIIENDINLEQLKITTLQNNINNIQLNYENSINNLNNSQKYLINILEKEKNIHNIFDLIHVYENNVDTITNDLYSTNINSNNNSSNNNNDKSNILLYLKNYLCIEEKCINYISKRMILVHDKIQHLIREVTEYRNMGMQVYIYENRFFFFVLINIVVFVVLGK
jgi:chromosome segregation ATPase